LRITFKKLKFRNFASFGNKITEIDFTPGLNSIGGKSGVGKSTIVLDTLAFVLYGKAYRKIKKSELINRTTGSGLWVSIEFKRNEDTYIIERGIKPNIFTIKKNGEDLELLSSNKFNQDELDKIIGINYFLFKHIISTASSNNKSFLSLSAWDKRNVIESIFNLKQISEMHTLLKIDRSDNIIKIDNLNLTKNNFDEILKSLKTQLNEIDIIINDFNKDKKEKLSKYYNNILNIQNTIKEKISEVEELLAKLNEYDKDYLKIIKDKNAELSSMQKNIGSINARLKINKKTLDVLNENTICPTCKTEMTEEHKNIETTKIKSEMKIDISKLEQTKNDIKIIKQAIKELIEANDNKNDLLNKKEHMIQDIKSLEQNLKNYIEESKKLDNENCSINSDNISKLIKEKENELNIIYKDLDEAEEKSKVYDILYDMFGDTGIKTEFYNMIIPLLNKNINKLLQQFEMPILFKFDYNLDYIINSVYSPDENINYYSFSEGEKKRIDLALMLSFITLNKMISNWDSNLLIADELFTNLDKQGVANVIQSLKDIVLVNNNICLYIVSHNLSSDTEYSFDNKILVIKDDGFSKIMYI